jgi:putative Holliday junction resolvase
MLTNKPLSLAPGKIAALDLGDQWVGIALSDITRTLAKPFTTVTFYDYLPALKKIIDEQKPAAIVIGYPKTMRGTESDQTKKIVALHTELEKLFPETQFILWDERLSSKRAETASPARTKEEKLKSHAIAAAFILDSYLSYLKMQDFLHHD